MELKHPNKTHFLYMIWPWRVVLTYAIVQKLCTINEATITEKAIFQVFLIACNYSYLPNNCVGSNKRVDSK